MVTPTRSATVDARWYDLYFTSWAVGPGPTASSPLTTATAGTPTVGATSESTGVTPLTLDDAQRQLDRPSAPSW
jgi:hypothetical protein